MLAHFAFVTAAPHRMWPDASELPGILVRSGIAVAIGFVIQRLLFLFVGRIERWILRLGSHNEQAQRRATTIGEMLRNLLTAVIAAFVLVRVLDVFGWNVQPLLAGAGLVGVALGFGAQTLVRDVISGVFVIAEDQFGVGDVIDVNGQVGTVEALTVRITTLRDEHGYRVTIPNGEMKVVINRSREWNRTTVDVTVAAYQDLTRALDVCRQVAGTMSMDSVWKPRLMGAIEVLGLESFSRVEATIRLALRTAPGKDSQEATRELRSRLYDALMRSGVRGTMLAASAPDAAVQTPGTAPAPPAVAAATPAAAPTQTEPDTKPNPGSETKTPPA